MGALEVIIPLFTHFIPILFFVYMGIDVLLRDTKKVEHQLLGAITLCFMLLFTEEYVRHQLPISYSPVLASLWFSSAGILIPGLGFHLMIKFARLERKMPRYVYPYIFYLPVILILFNLFTNEKVISAHEFIQMGIWKIPVYNKPYYIAMITSIANNLLYLIPLIKGKSSSDSKEHRAVLNLLIYGGLIAACWFAVFGLVHFGNSMPPYPYLYGGLVWCFFLRRAMGKYDFLNFDSKRYQKLFNINPSAILLADLYGNIKEANPSALQMFNCTSLLHTKYDNILNAEICNRIVSRQEIRYFETTLYISDQPIHVLVNGDYVLMDYEPHIILILQDVTIQKENQKEITFLAYHDPLTRLPNRRHFYEKLEEAIHEATIHDHKLAVILIDLDHFKDVNDKYGHRAGDELLIQTSAIINETVEHRGMTARLGGDEFVLYLNPVLSVQCVETMMQQLEFTFNQAMLEQMSVPVGMSVGASYFPLDGEDADDLIMSADRAMYRAKRQRKDNYQATFSIK